MFHISYLQAKQDQLEADGLFNPAFFGNQARGFLKRPSDLITKSVFCFCCMSVDQGSDPPDLDSDSVGSVDPDSESGAGIR